MHEVYVEARERVEQIKGCVGVIAKGFLLTNAYRNHQPEKSHLLGGTLRSRMFHLGPNPNQIERFFIFQLEYTVGWPEKELLLVSEKYHIRVTECMV